MAVSKRRISQKCRKTEDTDIPSDNEEEGIRFDPNKKVLRARRRNERGPAAKVSLIGSEPPRYSMDQKLKGLNHSFIQSVTLAYNKDNTYNFSSISSQYTKYREEIVEREGVQGTSLLNTTQRQNMADILRAGLGQTTPSKPPMDQDQMKKAEFILGQHGSIGAGLFGAAALNRQKEEERAALDVSQTEKKQETAKRSESMPSSPKKVAQKEDTHKAESADEVNSREPKGENSREAKGETDEKNSREADELAPGKSEKQKTPGSPKKDVHHKEAHHKKVSKESHKEAHKEVSKEATKDSKETKNSHSKDSHHKEVKTKDSHQKEVSKDETVKSGDKTKSTSLFDMTCKVFVRNTSRFEDLGFHRVAVKEVQGKRTIIVYDNKKKKETEMISVSLDKTSIQSDRSRKELAFVEPSSTLLYKIKLATLEDATALRRACNSENTSSTK
ncbi:hypothetical protein NERG_02398 [Nematocida ausubeli]|uniref:Uncharacterized protein n=1 Tax=Nematocida ausubeli (strain ATCC PRA-371 / ERTm2) TaxID=1913371 RepID=H8ZFM7_NEMA1|nr:hypothetical protein NERG_02398 [Nematocida ausubeli]